MTPRPEDGPDEPRLDSWKEIASYLGRGIRTVQRWEREEGLPVHRLDHAKRGSVYASRRELTAWWESRRRPDSGSASTNAAASAPPREPRSERVTATSAATFWPALSSDARMVVYVSDAGKDGESPQVWLQQVGGAAVQLTSGQRDCAEPTFSADDTRVLFTATGESTRNVYEIPTLGGQPRLGQTCGPERQVLTRREVARLHRDRGTRLAASRAHGRWRRAHTGHGPR